MKYGCNGRSPIISFRYERQGGDSLGLPRLVGIPVMAEDKCHFTLSPRGKTDTRCTGCRLSINSIATQKVT